MNNRSLYEQLLNVALEFNLDKANKIFIAYSGGIDSHVLLQLCASTLCLKQKLVAVHVHHGLQLKADSWAIHCRKIAKELSVDFLLLKANASAKLGESPEEAARNSRYAALKPLIQFNDVLLIAQHREDQLETILLQLFRGSGLIGLAGIPKYADFGNGIMLRPLLGVPKRFIRDYAIEQQLVWVDDPSNKSNSFDRNFLRNAVIPLLKERWPSLDKTVARSANHCLNAQIEIESVVDGLYSNVYDELDGTLCAIKLNEFSFYYQCLIIRRWVRYFGLRMPSEALLSQMMEQLLSIKNSNEPLIVFQNHLFRRYRNKIYCLQADSVKKPQNLKWSTDVTSLNIGGGRFLSYVPANMGINYKQWKNAAVDVRYRNGGESIQLPGRLGRHSLKKLFQEAGVPPWERDNMPLIYMNDELVAIGDRWVSAAFWFEGDNNCIRFCMHKEIKASKVTVLNTIV